MRNFVKVVLVAALALPLAAQAQISTTKHNLSSGSGNSVTSAGANATNQICIFCHTPHNASTTKALWNHNPSTTATYNWNDSSTVTATSQGTTLPTSLTQFSVNGSGRCLSCHDGSISLGSVMNFQGAPTTFTFATVAGRVTATGSIDTTSRYAVGELGNLGKNHPVGIPFPGQTGGAATTAGYFGAITTGCSSRSGGGCVNNGINGAQLPLYVGTGAGNPLQIECASCHEPHGGPGFAQFLRVTTSASQLCLTCHNK